MRTPAPAIRFALFTAALAIVSAVASAQVPTSEAPASEMLPGSVTTPVAGSLYIAPGYADSHEQTTTDDFDSRTREGITYRGSTLTIGVRSRQGKLVRRRG